MTQQNSTVNPFSNHWKVAAKSFQSLENRRNKFPIIGKSTQKVSNHWKTSFLALFVGMGMLQTVNAGDIHLHMLTTGEPADTHYVGDTLGDWYVQFEVGQNSWNASEAGIGPSNDGTSWNWAAAAWYQDGDAPNKRVQRNIGAIQFTSAGNWYFAGRAKADADDSWHYANSDVWGNSDTLSASYYFTISALSDPISPSASKGSVYPNSTADLSWSRWDPGSGEKNVMVVRRKGLSVAWNPDQGISYSNGEDLGNNTYVVLASASGTTHTDTDLESGATYYYKFYSINNNYYSGGTETSVTLEEALVKATFNGYERSGLNGQSDATTDIGLDGTWIASNATVVGETTMSYEINDIVILGSTNRLNIERFSSARELAATRNLSISIPKTTPVIYIGFLAQFNNSLNSTDFACIALDDDDSDSSQLAIGFDDDLKGDFKVQLGGSSAYGGPVDITEGQAYYVVAKFLGGTKFTNATVFINPTNTAVGQAEYIFSVTNNSGFDVDLTLMNIWHDLGSGSDSYNFDQIVIGTTWGDVVYSNDHPTAVVLSSFTAATENDQVVVRWQTSSEDDTAGFMLYRENELGNRVQINDGFIPAEGHDGMGASYVLVDATAEKDTTYSYVLVEYELDGTQDEHAFVRNTSELMITAPIRPVAGGIELRWLSREDEAYTILRAESLPGAFQSIAEGILATPPENTYLDETAGNQAYYRIGIDQD